MANHTGNGTTPPFHESKRQPVKTKPSSDNKRQALSTITLALGWVALTVAMVGGGKLLWDILTEGFSLANIWGKIISLGLTFLLGWVISLVCIRAFGNLILLLLMQIYIFFTVSGILILYGRVVYKLYTENFLTEQHYERYSLAIAIGFAVLVGLHLLIEDHDLRPFSIPFLIAGMLHLSSMVYHYVFMNGNQANVMADVYFFAIVILIAALMLVHLGIFNLPRKLINNLFNKSADMLRPNRQ